MKNIFVFGSVNMDLSIECERIPMKGETMRGYGFIESPGGKGANQAVAAAKTGAPVFMIAKTGADHMGAEVTTSLKGYGVDCRYVMNDGSATGIAVILRSKEDNRIICDYGANYELSSDDAINVLKKAAKPGDLLVCQFECRHEDVLRAIMEAKKLGMVTVFNPAPAAEIPEEMYQFFDYITVNQTECGILTGVYPETFQECCSALDLFIRRGAGCAIITLGELGSVCLRGGEYTEYPAFKVGVVDTTAAGDAYIGAFVSKIAAGDRLGDALRFATAAAAITATRLGAQQAVPNASEVEEFMRDYT